MAMAFQKLPGNIYTVQCSGGSRKFLCFFHASLEQLFVTPMSFGKVKRNTTGVQGTCRNLKLFAESNIIVIKLILRHKRSTKIF
jgi:hypothetical protein